MESNTLPEFGCDNNVKGCECNKPWPEASTNTQFKLDYALYVPDKNAASVHAPAQWIAGVVIAALVICHIVLISVDICANPTLILLHAVSNSTHGIAKRCTLQAADCHASEQLSSVTG